MNLKDSMIFSIKKAMQGEMDSVLLYQNAANYAKDLEVKNFFEQRKEEERAHYNYLLQYYQELSNDLQPTDLTSDIDSTQIFHPIISPSFLKRIGEDQILFSAISTAILLEKDAIEHYESSAHETDEVSIKSLFMVLKEWEIDHYETLLNIQKEAEIYYWQINQFEPF